MSKLSDRARTRQENTMYCLFKLVSLLASGRSLPRARICSYGANDEISDTCPTKQTGIGMAIAADKNSDLFIDGKLVPGGNGRHPAINTGTEEGLGTAGDGDTEDMGRAREAARRPFDTTDWSTNTELRVRGIRQLRDAMKEHVEELREMTMAEVGAPRMLTSAAQLEGPVEDLSFCADTAENYSWRHDLGVAAPMG